MDAFFSVSNVSLASSDAVFAVLCVEITKGAKEGPVGPALLLLTGLLKSQAGHATLPPKTLKVCYSLLSCL